MELEERKQRLREGIAAFGNGDPGPFTSLLDPGIQWTIIGSSSYSGTLDGVAELGERHFGRLAAALDGPLRLTIHNMIAEGDYVVCECGGESKTKTGQEYNNSYCILFRWSDDKIVGVNEYLDTELVTAKLG